MSEINPAILKPKLIKGVPLPAEFNKPPLLDGHYNKYLFKDMQVGDYVEYRILNPKQKHRMLDALSRVTKRQARKFVIVEGYSRVNPAEALKKLPYLCVWRVANLKPYFEESKRQP